MNLWLARIDGRKNGVRSTGAGVLVDRSRLLTCAHVVAGCSDLRVSFAQADRADLQDLPASVDFAGPWARPGDRGDVAVLRLEQEVALTPAPLSLRPDSSMELTAHGFPLDLRDAGGSPVRVRLTSADGIGEWQHLETVAGHGDFPRKGFSGTGVYREATGEVYGLVSDTSNNASLRTGRMVPLRTVRRYWEELDDLLELGWLDVERRHSLRRLVRDAQPGLDLAALVVREFPSAVRPRDLRTVWDTITFVAEDLYGEDRLVRLLSALSRQVGDRLLAAGLRRWLEVNLTTTPAAPPGPSSIVIRLDQRTKGGYQLGFSHLIGDRPYPGTRGGTVERKQIRPAVERAFGELVSEHTDPLVEFVAPRGLLNEPVEEWYASKAHRIRMAVYRVVVRDVSRLSDPVLRDVWTARFERCKGETRCEQVHCHDPRTPDSLYRWLLRHDRLGVLLYGTRPSKQQLDSTLRAGIPVMLWPRTKCCESEGGDCTGSTTLAVLGPLADDGDTDDLPDRVRKLRHQHEGALKLTLLWDDPRRLPEPPTFLEERHG